MRELLDGSQALAWAHAERVNLFGCLDHVTESGQHARVVELTAALAVFLLSDGPWPEAIARHTTAVRAASHVGDRSGQAGALHDLAVAHRMTGTYPAAAAALGDALSIYRDLGDRLGRPARCATSPWCSR